MKVDPRFLRAEGQEIFTGNELLIKGALETEGGVNLLGGYPGSPASDFFNLMATIKDLLTEKGIRAVMNSNEALASAMLNGSQTMPCRAMIAMKSVGAHVAADALALGNLAGANSDGGAVVVFGDDPWSDSTQVPADSRYISKHLHMPVVEPANPQEIKDYVDMAFKLSRWSELYAAYVLTTNLADGGGTVECRPNQYPKLNMNRPIDLETAAINLDKRVLLPPKTWWQEESLPERFERAVAAARKLSFNQILYPSARPKPIGFATSGMAHGYLLQALFEMGLLGEYPIMKFGLSYPVDAELIRKFSAQCERIVVIEERRGFLQEQIGEVILRQGQVSRPAYKAELWGKTFPGGLKGIPDVRGLHPSILIARLVPLIKLISGSRTHMTIPDWAEALDREIETIDSTAQATTELSGLPTRSPTFCPGCPHRDSADLCLEVQKRFKDPQYMARKHKSACVDLLFHGDTGCYTMLMFPPNTSLMHDYSGMGLGGGTGSGTDPFVTNKEVVFMGDGTFFHSGQIAISQAVKLGQDITFVILDNSITAMTAHQPTPGVDWDIIGNTTPVQDIEDIVAAMAGDSGLSVARVNPEKRDQYMELLEKTFLSDGVKVVIADKECGITRMRRKRRQERAIIKQRGFLPSWDHMNVNQEVCTFCLACAEMTGCPGLRHAQTDYGRKMDTDLTWCVDDGACERLGACRAFEHVTIKRKRPPKSRLPELDLDHIPEPAKSSPKELWRCCLVGVGGMGIGLAASIIVRAGHNEGYEVVFLDKKGLAIRNGGVTSQVIYNISHKPVTAIIPFGKADLLIGMDILEAARSLDPRGRTRIASPDRTAAVMNTDKIATINGLMGKDDFNPADLERLILNHVREEEYLARDLSRLCEKYLGSKLYANVMMLGFAFQKGLIPVSMHSMAWAIKDTIRIDFRKNLYAFNMGRKLVVQPELFQGPPKRSEWRDLLEEKCRWTIRRYWRGQKLADQLRELTAGLIDKLKALDEPLKRAIVVRTYDIMRWGGIEYAQRYVRNLAQLYSRDSAEYGYAATEAGVYALASAMLIPDSVYLAELSTSPEKYARDREKYSVSLPHGDRIVHRYLWHCTLPWGSRKIPFKLTLRPWQLQLLKRSRYLRKLTPRSNRRRREFLARYEAMLEGFTYTGATQYAQQAARLSGLQCMNCLNPRCQEEGCPLSSSVPQWIDRVYKGDWRGASDLLHRDNNFPEFTSRICPTPCQAKCKQGINTFTVQIRDLEAQIVDRAFADGYVTPVLPAAKTGKRVAVVGSGPAGLAAAQQLARAGHDVVVFEKDPLPGGLLRYGIPPFRLDKALLDRRVKQLTEEGIEFRGSMMVGRNVSGQELRRDFDAVLLATGAAKARDLNVPGRANRNVHFALDFLQNTTGVKAAAAAGAESSTLEVKGKVVAVIGGGETGNDCVESALMGGAKEVWQFEILPQPNAPKDGPGAGASDAEKSSPGFLRSFASAAGQYVSDRAAVGSVHRRWCVATKEFEGAGPRLNGLKAVEVRWLLTPAGKVMTEVPGSEFRMAADLAVLALGFDPVVEAPLAKEMDLEVDSSGRAVLRDYATSVEGVFAAGDLATGASLVAGAIHSGRKAAAKIDEFLRKTADEPLEADAIA